MIEQIATIRLFYPMLFLTIVIIAVVLIFAIKAILIKFKDDDSQNFRFKTHVDEHTDTTSKMKSMHDNVVKVDFTVSHEKELHLLEQNVKELNIKVDLLMEKVIAIERKFRQ